MICVTKKGSGIELGTLPEIPARWRDWAAQDPLRWKRLACLTLSTAGWSYPQIGGLFGHDKGQVAKLVHQARQGIAEFRLPDAELREQPARDLADAG